MIFISKPLAIYFQFPLYSHLLLSRNYGEKNGLKLTSFTNVQGTTDFQLVRSVEKTGCRNTLMARTETFCVLERLGYIYIDLSAD